MEYMIKLNRRYFTPCGAACLLLLIAVAVCVGCGGAAAGTQSNYAQTPLEQGPPLAMVPAPGSVKLTSAVVPGYVARGRDWVAEFGLQHALAEGDSLRFDPVGEGADGVAWAVYLLSPRGYSDDGTVELKWGTAPLLSNLWIGLGNIESRSWEWRRVSSQQRPKLDPRHRGDQGEAFIALVITGESPSVLEQVSLNVALPSPHDEITAGAATIDPDAIGSQVVAFDDGLEPVCWGSPKAVGKNKIGLAGTLPVPGWAGYFGNGRVSVWTGHAGFFGAGKDGLGDNDLVRPQWYSWLLNGGTRIGFTSTHSEWNKAGVIAGSTKAWMDAEGITYENVGEAVSSGNLENYDLLIVGNPWGQLTQDELAAIEEWVFSGGAVFAWGLGWSWHSYNYDPDGTEYSINKLGAIFGWKALNGTLQDYGAPNGSTGHPNYAIAPLAEYSPAEVVVLSAAEQDVNQVRQLAQARPDDVFVIEGDHIGLQLPTHKWADLDDVSAALAVLDLMYETQAELVQHENLPYGGETVWYVSQDSDGSWWMHAGNPIFYKTAAADSVIGYFNSDGYPGWGFSHEMGHDYHGSACGNIMVVGGTVEPWANIFNVYAYEQLGWPERSGSYEAGHEYHYQDNPDFAELTSSNWIFLGCMQLIWDKYGWAGISEMTAEAARRRASGQSAGDNAARTAFLVEEISHGYELDFSPLFIHWGFPVSADTQAITDVYPDADIPW